MAARLFPFARAIVDFKVTDTWDPAGTDHRKDEWIGGLYYDYDATDGYLVYRCVKNTGAGAIAAALVVATEAGEVNIDHVDAAGANTAAPRVRGVTIGSIPAGHCGFVVCQGKVTATDSGSAITVNKQIATAASGDIADATIGTHAVIGSGMAAIGANATGKVYISVL